MTSHSSSSCSLSVHLYHNEWCQSTTSIQTIERWRTVFSQVMGTFKRENLPPLSENAYHSSSSPPPDLPALPPMLFNLPPFFLRTTLLSIQYNSSWAITPGFDASNRFEDTWEPVVTPPTPFMVTLGTILPFRTVLTSQLTPVLLMPGPLFSPQSTIPVSPSGTSSSRTGSSHSSLYQSSKNQLLDHSASPDLPGEKLMNVTLWHLSIGSGS